MDNEHTGDVLERAQKRVDWWSRQVQQAEDYRARDQSPALCFAVVGIPKEPALEFHSSPLFTFRAVENPPGEIALARGAKKMSLFGAIGRYMPGVHYELAVHLRDGQEETIQEALNLGWVFFTGLRIKTNSDFLVPAVLDCSWNALAAYDDHSRYVQLLEDAPRASRKSKSFPVTIEGLQWAAEHVESLRVHWEHPGFQLAAECFNTHSHSGNQRFAITALWSGIEALFEIEHELRFRLATSIAAFLEPPGVGRLELYRKVGKMYDVRSKIVHGAKVKSAAEVVPQHLNDASELLARLLQTIIENGYPSRQKLDELIFGV